MSDLCCECGKPNEAPGPWDDWSECDRCRKPLCDECWWKHPHGDDSTPYAHCSACEADLEPTAAPALEPGGGEER
jgi:hypothetical protein